MIWMILGASLPGLFLLVFAMCKVVSARRRWDAAERVFGEAGMRLLVAQAKEERAVALCKYASKCLEVGRQHNDRARDLMNGEGEF